MFVECNHAVCCWFGAAGQEKKESLSILAFKYLRVAMLIWKANIYCTHLHEVRNRDCAHACILICTCTQGSRRNLNLWEGRGVRKRVFTPCQRFVVFLKKNLRNLLFFKPLFLMHFHPVYLLVLFFYLHFGTFVSLGRTSPNSCWLWLISKKCNK